MKSFGCFYKVRGFLVMQYLPLGFVGAIINRPAEDGSFAHWVSANSIVRPARADNIRPYGYDR